MWLRDGGTFILLSSAALPLSRLTVVSHIGVESGVLLRRHWGWDKIKAMTWVRYRTLYFLAVCLREDRPACLLTPGAWTARGIRAPLAVIRPFVEEMGALVVNPDPSIPAAIWY